MPLASLIGRWAMKPFARALPPLGETERAALEAGTVGFEGLLFAGRPDFDRLARTGPNRLDEREQAFLDHEVRELCRMLDDHAIDQASCCCATAPRRRRRTTCRGSPTAASCRASG